MGAMAKVNAAAVSVIQVGTPPGAVPQHGNGATDGGRVSSEMPPQRTGGGAGRAVRRGPQGGSADGPGRPPSFTSDHASRLCGEGSKGDAWARERRRWG